MNYNYINNDLEHFKILFELGILDDLEDWEMYKEQEKRFDTDVDIETYFNYVKK